MSKIKVLIVVKTYPTLSGEYDELVCTAGFCEDGSWIRLYPIPYRKLKSDNQYEKWQWIEIDAVRNKKDFRKESFRPISINVDLQLGDKIGTANDWSQRREIALRNVKYDLDSLISEAKDPTVGTSLAVLKPKQVIDFIWEEEEREWNQQTLNKIYARQTQGNLFEEQEETRKLFKVVKKLPYKFSYVFTTEDCKERKLMIEDWELGMLYWNCLEKSNGNEFVACQKVKEKYFDYMVNKRDLYFFLGTTKKFHNVAPNPFIIIGTFYPPRIDENQLSLF